MSRRAARCPSGFDLLLGLLLVGLAASAGDSAPLRGFLAGLAAVALLWPGSRERAVERRRTRLIVGLALASLTVSISPQVVEFTTTWKVRVWNVYHYYLGAKYFSELGYTDLYDATLVADRDGERYFRGISRVRNLHDYAIEGRRYRLRSYDPVAFEPERWQQFASDVRALSGHRPADEWRGIFVDRGYNGTPLWTVVGGTLARLAPADRPLALKLLASLDLLLLAATFVLIRRTFGVRLAALVLLLLTISPVNAGRFVGGFLQFDWFCAVAAGCCWYRLRRDVVASAALAYAALTRIFPVLFVVAGLIPAVAWARRHKRWPRRPLRFAALFALWCGLGLMVSLANGRGLDGWREFVTAITVHREHHLYGQRRIGLQQIFTHEPGSFEARHKRRVYERQHVGFLLAATALSVYFVGVAWRLRSGAAQLWGLAPIFAWVLTSRYYAAYLALLPLAGGPRGPPESRARAVAAAQLAVFAVYYAYTSRVEDLYAGYSLLNLLLAAFFAMALTAELVGSKRRDPGGDRASESGISTP